jgi:hypothetical protein
MGNHTQSETGAAIEKLSVTIKVAIGEGPEPGNGNSQPRKLDHFVFKRKTCADKTSFGIH